VKLHLAYWWIWWHVQNETKYATSSSAACGRKEGKREKKGCYVVVGPAFHHGLRKIISHSIPHSDESKTR